MATIPVTGIENGYSKMTRKDFPKDFVFGTGTSAYQVEGAAATYGRGNSIWDEFTSRTPSRISDGSNGKEAVDMYNRFKEDIKWMKDLGFDAYRFSISWPRIIPNGKVDNGKGINVKGIEHYNDLIDTLDRHGIKPYVTLFHWDLPDALEKEYGGFLSENIVDDYRDFVKVCFEHFGGKVKHWATFNEPWTYCYLGYVRDRFPPGKKANTSAAAGAPQMSEEDKVFIAAKNMILAHAAAVKLYKSDFQKQQEGEIGIVLNIHWFEPLKNTEEDKQAARRAHDFKLGWFLEPVLIGRYPKTMGKYVPPAAQFTEVESEMLKKYKIDFLGVNYYTARYVQNNPYPDPNLAAFDKYQETNILDKNKDGKPIGPVPGASWLIVVPWGIKKLLKRINELYNNSEYKLSTIYITENGVAERDDDNHNLTFCEATDDTTRVEYYRDHLGNILDVINEWKPLDSEKKLEIKGFFAWSWVDNFEWDSGYTLRFGLIYIDYMNNLERYQKRSAKWFSKFLAEKIPTRL